MEDEHFGINFQYDGKEYIGIVREGAREDDLTFVVTFTEAVPGRGEQIIELCIVQGVDPNRIVWGEYNDEVGSVRQPFDLIQVIGQAIEAHDR